MQFIHAADCHVDSPLRGLDRYDGAPVEELRGATRRALENLVELALGQSVAFVILAGDIFDDDWQDFHTGLFFVEQMARLARAGIPVYMAYGNHDSEGGMTKRLPLPDNVHVFSSRSAESFILAEHNVVIHGRSYPERKVTEDFVPDYPAAVPNHFNIGVLHTSLDGRPGHDTYAPTTGSLMVDKGYDYWALGHVHQREVVREMPRIVFPGNIQGRHAREMGSKGCDLVTVDGSSEVVSEHMPLDVVRWHRVDLDLTGLEDIQQLKAAVLQRLQLICAEDPVRLHAIRLVLTGQSQLHEDEARAPGTLAATARTAVIDLANGLVWIEKVIDQLQPILDRGLEAKRDDAIGELFRLVDEIAIEPDRLREFVDQQLQECYGRLPPELQALEELLGGDGPGQLLLDSEATIYSLLSAQRGHSD